MKTPAKSSLHGDGEGGLGWLVGELRPLGGQHEALVVSGGSHLDNWISQLHWTRSERLQVTDGSLRLSFGDTYSNSLGVHEAVVPENVTL